MLPLFSFILSLSLVHASTLPISSDGAKQIIVNSLQNDWNIVEMDGSTTVTLIDGWYHVDDFYICGLGEIPGDRDSSCRTYFYVVSAETGEMRRVYQRASSPNNRDESGSNR
jgi:hypothetical protein